jgi:transposase-like protein
MTGSLEESILEMYLQGVSTRKVEQITGKLSGQKISKDAVSRICARFDEVFSEWRERQLDKSRSYPYLYLDATYPPRRGGRARRAGPERCAAWLCSWLSAYPTKDTARCSL